MKFIAEIVEIKERKTISLDKEYTVKLRTEDNSVMTLSTIPADELVSVEIKGEHDKSTTG
jgi:hypothetical protein